MRASHQEPWPLSLFAKTFDKRYYIVAGALLVQSVTIGCMFAYGVFFKSLETEFGWSRTLLSAATSVSFLCMGILAIVAGRLNDRYGPRWVLAFSGICTGAGYCSMYFLQAPWQLLIVYSILVGVGLSTHDVVTLSTVARWFPRRRGIMTGVVKVGTAVGQMVVPLIAFAMIGAIGWRLAFVGLGVSAVVLLMVAVVLIGVKATAPAASTEGPVEKKGLTFAQARRSPQLWIMCAMQFFFFASLVSIPTHIVSHGIDIGMSAAVAATLLSVIAASSIIGRLMVGFFVDKLGGRRAFLLCIASLFISLSMLVVFEGGRFLYLFSLFYGFAHGGLFTVVSPAVAEYFGMREHGVIFGTILFFGTMGGAIMPIVTGMIFDSTGSYTVAFVVMAAMAFIGLILAFSLSVPDVHAGQNE